MPVPLILLWRKTAERLLAALTGCFFFFSSIAPPLKKDFKLRIKTINTARITSIAMKLSVF